MLEGIDACAMPPFFHHSPTPLWSNKELYKLHIFVHDLGIYLFFMTLAIIIL